jgi:hypothetical protein
MSYKNKFIEEASFVKDRIEDMVAFRGECGCEQIWRNADSAIKIKPLRSKFALNYGNNKVNLKSSDWQSDNSDITPFTKLHIALSVLAEQNPRATFKNYQRGTQVLSHFHSKLYDYSLHKEMFKFKLQRFIYNQGKYGIAFSCTKARNDYRTVRDLVSMEDGKEQYEETKTEDYKGVWFKPLSNWQVYWDDGAEVYDPWSMKDWCYYEWYTKKQIKEMYQKFDINQLSEETANDEDGKEQKRKNLYKIYYYENYKEDLEVIYHNGKVLDAFPLPTDQHKLSLNYAPWNLRDSSSIDGVGLVEILQQDKNLFDKVNNMSVDQLVLSIYKSFFYDGTNEEDGVLVLQPGRGQQVLDPSKVKFLEMPGNNAEVYNKMGELKETMDANTFSKTLGGETLAGKTAYEIESIKNASVRRLANPLDGLMFALTTDAYTRMDILHSMATPSDIQEITDPAEAEAVLAVYRDNPETYKIDEGNGIVYRYIYDEVPLPLTRQEDEYVPSDDINFFPLTPEGVRFNGDIEIDVKSILLPSPELEKKQIVEMANLVVPMFQIPREIAEKPARQILKAHNQDEKDWFPESWMQPIEEMPPQIDPETGQPMQPEQTQQPGPPQELPQSPTLVSPEKVGENTGIVGKLANILGMGSK